MKKGKKVLAMSLALAMVMTSLTACGGKDNAAGKTPEPTRAGSGAVDIDTSNPLVLPEPAAVEKKSDAEKVNFTVWCPAEEKKIMQQLCETFNKTVPNYDVTVEIKDMSEATASTTLSQDAKKSADVLMFSGDQLSSLVEQKLLFNISELNKMYPDLKGKYDESAYASCVRDNSLYALPFTPNQFFLYYNNTMLTEDDVKDLGTMMDKDLGTDVKNFATEIANGWYLASFFYAGGCSLYGTDGNQASECDWNSPNGLKVVKYLNNMVATKKFHKNSGTDDALGLMEDGKLASWATGSWKSNAIKEVLGEKYAAAAMPKITFDDGSSDYIKPFADFKVIGVNTYTSNPECAAMLAYFLADEYAQSVRLASRAYSPTVKSLMEAVKNSTAEDKLDPAVVAGTIQSDSEHSVLRPVTSQISKYWTTGETLGNYIFDQKDPVTDDSKVQKTMDQVVSNITSGASK